MPSYNFENGITLGTNSFDKFGNVDAQENSYSLDDIHAIEARLTKSNDEYLKVRDDIENSRFASVGINKKNNDILMEYAVLNSANPSNEATLLIPGWGANFRRPGTARAIAAVALELDSPTIVINPLGQGRSSNVPRGRSKDSLRLGSYMPQGDLHNRGIDQIKQEFGFESINIVGESRGHRLALGMLAAGLEVESAVLVDGTGFPSLGPKGLKVAMDKEKENSRLYTANYISDPTIEEAEKEIDLYKESGLMKRMLSGHLWQHFVLDVLTLGKSGAMDFAAALPNIKNKVDVVSLEESHLTDSHYVEKTCQSLALSDNRPDKMTHTVAYEVSHAVNSRCAGARTIIMTNGLELQSASKN